MRSLIVCCALLLSSQSAYAAENSVQFAATPADIEGNDGQSILTQGRLVAGDGGAAHYIYHRKKPADIKIDGGFFIALEHGYLEAVDKTIVNVRQFGACGDQTINQTEVLQTAIDVAIRYNLDVYFPPGWYLFDKLRCDSPSRWIGAGKTRTVLYATKDATGALIEDSGNGAKFTMEHIRIQGCLDTKGSQQVTSVLRLGHNAFPWGSGGILNNVIIFDFPNAIGIDVNQNISKIENCWMQNCLTGIKAVGNGLNLSHVQVTAPKGIALEILSPCRIYDLEIEAPFASPVLQFGRQSHVFGLHISLAPKDLVGHLETLIEWQQASGQLIGPRVDLSGAGEVKSTYTNFMSGARTLSTPADVFFDPVSLRSAP